jgi:hypothetical protein
MTSKEPLLDLFFDKRRNVVEMIMIIQAPFIFFAVAYLFGLEISVIWVIKAILAFVLFIILIKGRSFLHGMTLVSDQIASETLVDPTLRDKNTDFIPWNKYRKRIRRLSMYSIIVLIAITLIARYYVPAYYRDIFLVLIYLDSFIFVFLTLNNANKYILLTTTTFLDYKSGETLQNHENIFKARTPNFKFIIYEFLLLAFILLILLNQIIELRTFQYVQYFMVLFILYFTSRRLIQTRRYFISCVQFIDKIRINN